MRRGFALVALALTGVVLAQSYPGIGSSPLLLNTPILSAQASGSAQITINLVTAWNSPATPITYSLECSSTSDSEGFSEVASGTDIFEEGYVYDELIPETQYWCKTEGTDDDLATSGYSNIVTATTEADIAEEPPSTPTGLAIATVTESTLEGWTWDAITGETSVRVILGIGDGNNNPQQGVPLVYDQTFAADTVSLDIVDGLDSNQQYYGRICAQNSKGAPCGSRLYVTTDPAEGDNNPPVWNSTPTPSTTEGVGGSYNLLSDVADPDGDTLTCELNSESEDLPTGVTLNSNCSFSDNGTGGDGTTTGILVDADDGTNDPVVSPSFSYAILAEGEADIVVDDSGGFDFTTIGAAMAAANCGQTIEVRSGTYSEGLWTRRNCTAGSPIVVREQSGQNVIIDSWVSRSGTTAFLHFEHSFWECCDGFLFQGTSDPVPGEDVGGAPSRGVRIASDDVYVRGNFRNTPSVTVTAAGSWQRVRINIDARTNGNAHQANDEDSGDHFRIFGANQDYIIDHSFLAEGGHSSGIFEATNILLYQNLYRNDWGTYVYSPTVANRGSRHFEFREANNVVLRRIVMRERRMSVDSARSALGKFDTPSVSVSQAFGIDGTSGGACTGAGYAKSSGWGNNYWDHVTCHKIDGPGWHLDVESVNADNHGPAYIKNSIVSDMVNAPGSGDQNAVISLRYDSRRDPWTDVLFVDGLISDANYNVRIVDLAASHGTITMSLTNAQSNFPANFKNITIVNPNFVSTSNSTSTDPLTAWNQTVANFTPQASAAVGTGQPLTLVDGAVNNSATVTVDDDRWFRDDMGWDEVWDGDQITLCGSTVYVTNNQTLGNGQITVSSPVTCSNNAPIYRGADSTPNMGAAL